MQIVNRCGKPASRAPFSPNAGARHLAARPHKADFRRRAARGTKGVA